MMMRRHEMYKFICHNNFIYAMKQNEDFYKISSQQTKKKKNILRIERLNFAISSRREDTKNFFLNKTC